MILLPTLRKKREGWATRLLMKEMVEPAQK